jgi:hypothetical protein
MVDDGAEVLLSVFFELLLEVVDEDGETACSMRGQSNGRDGLMAVLTPKFGKVRSLTCGSNAVRNPSGRRKVSSEEFGKRVHGRQFASVRQENCYTDFAGLRGDVARAEGTNEWISDRI